MFMRFMPCPSSAFHLIPFPASVIARRDGASKSVQAMYSRLLTLTGHPTKYAPDATAWFEGVLLDLQKVGHAPKPRGMALRELDILKTADYKSFHTRFKKFWDKKCPTNRAAKAPYKIDLLEAKLKHIRETPWPCQAKRKLSVEKGEEERLLMLLYYVSAKARERKSKGPHSDESD
jgi:hypothetical protein